MKNLLKLTFITLFTFALTTSMSAQKAPDWDEGVAAKSIKLLPIDKDELRQKIDIFVRNLPSKKWSNAEETYSGLHTNTHQNIFVHFSGLKSRTLSIQISARTLKVLKKNKNLKAFVVKGYIIFVDEKGKRYKSGLRKAELRAIVK